MRKEYTQDGRNRKASVESEEGEDNRKNLQKDREFEIARQVVEFSIGLREKSNWILWRGRSPSKRKKRLHTE
jgi:hypothetical protein